jgi:hypothetical protein
MAQAHLLQLKVSIRANPLRPDRAKRYHSRKIILPDLTRNLECGEDIGQQGQVFA